MEQLRPVRYRWKSTGQLDIGLIAEDVAEVVPEIVRFNQSGQAETLRYSRIAAILVAAFQDLTQNQEQRLMALEAGGRQLREQVAGLIEENRRLERLARRNSELEDRLAHVESMLARDTVEMVRAGK